VIRVGRGVGGDMRGGVRARRGALEGGSSSSSAAAGLPTAGRTATCRLLGLGGAGATPPSGMRAEEEEEEVEMSCRHRRAGRPLDFSCSLHLTTTRPLTTWAWVRVWVQARTHLTRRPTFVGMTILRVVPPPRMQTTKPSSRSSGRQHTQQVRMRQLSRGHLSSYRRPERTAV
jgi:hypothetical protein